ncbi:MAG: nickel-responsive transcriptional regulator NikR [Thaumarchaeota archaeon]|nr:nickel-responsive transcriptional regulator NikR [Nitrososphaerota archaeon]
MGWLRLIIEYLLHLCRMVPKVARMSVSTPRPLLEEFDAVVAQMGYDRSKAVQQAMKNFITEHKWTRSKAKTVAGAVIFIYDHETSRLDEQLTDIQHHYAPIINSTLHLHLGSEDCLQIVAVKGSSEKIQRLSQEISVKRGVKQLKQAIVAP